MRKQEWPKISEVKRYNKVLCHNDPSNPYHWTDTMGGGEFMPYSVGLWINGQYWGKSFFPTLDEANAYINYPIK